MTTPATREHRGRTTLRKAAGVVRWAGLLGRRTELGRRVVVVSPHLDDGVLSLGAAISFAARRRGEVTVLTVLAGDPGSTAPAGPWDRRAGFATAGEAARVRRLEDAAACELVGARPVWLPFSDEQYERGGDDAEIRVAVVEAAGDAQVLVPGFPLLHPDHAWLRRLLEDSFPVERVFLYTEQPYAAALTERPGVDGVQDREGLPPPPAWRFLRAGLGDKVRKLRACRSYRSQLPLLGDGTVSSICRYELRVGGESCARLPEGR